MLLNINYFDCPRREENQMIGSAYLEHNFGNDILPSKIVRKVNLINKWITGIEMNFIIKPYSPKLKFIWYNAFIWIEWVIIFLVQSFSITARIRL